MCDDIIVKMFPDFATQLLVKCIDSFHFGIFKSIGFCTSEVNFDSNNNNYKIVCVA